MADVVRDNRPGCRFPHHTQVRASRAIVDEGMRDLLELMWANGFETQFSCQGRIINEHAYVVFASFEQATRFLLESNIRTDGRLWDDLKLQVMKPMEPEQVWRGAVEWDSGLTRQLMEAWS